MAVPSFESIDHIVSRSLTTRRFQVELAILFALTALVLTSLGLYSALTSTIRRRRSEIAVRMALGAKPAAIRWTVVVHALMPVAIGMGAGVAVAAFGISPLLRGLLFGTSTSDPRVIGLTVMVLGSVSFAASYVPAIRASTINPIIAMRSE
jgi:putative ABC transport system permease protein